MNDAWLSKVLDTSCMYPKNNFGFKLKYQSLIEKHAQN